MRTFNDFEVIREELARRQAEADMVARETGDYSPNVVKMSGMINMAEIRTSQERLADRLDRRRVQAGRKLVRLSSVDQRDVARRQLLAQMLADDLKPRNYDPEGLADDEEADFNGGEDMFDELLRQMEGGGIKRRRGVMDEAEEILPSDRMDEFDGGLDMEGGLDDEFDPDADIEGEGGEDYLGDIDRILQRGRGSRGI